MRNLLLFLLLLVFIYWVKRKLSNAGGGREARKTPRAGSPERVLACEVCGVHVPESEGVVVGEHFYCCEEHRR